MNDTHAVGLRHVRGVLSIQSSVVFGHVGSSAATLPLQRLGFDVWSLPTVLFSSHTGYSGFRGSKTPVATLRELLDGLAALGTFGCCEAVVTGYLGHPEVGSLVFDALARVREENPGALFVCDPVMGDHGELYVHPDLVRFFRERAVPAADLLVPNRFELGWLTDSAVESVADALDAIDALRSAGAGEVVAKGVVLPGASGALEQHIVGAGPEGAWLVRAPHIARYWSGAGDTFTALLTAHRLLGLALPQAIERTAAQLHALIALTHAQESNELRLVADGWLDAPVDPSVIVLETLR